MTKHSRRKFAGGLLAGSTALAMPSLAFGATPRVVVIGGGAGGVTAGRYVAKDSKSDIDITFKRRNYTTHAFTQTCILAASEIMAPSATTIMALPRTEA